MLIDELVELVEVLVGASVLVELGVELVDVDEVDVLDVLELVEDVEVLDVLVEVVALDNGIISPIDSL